MVQVFFVMLFFPVIMNALQYYIIDGFIKNQNLSDHEPIPSEDGEADNDGRSGRRDEDNVDAGFDGTEEAPKLAKPPRTPSKKGSTSRVSITKVDPNKLDEYNPDRDGEGSPTIVASSSPSAGTDEEESLLGKAGKGKTKKEP